VVSQLWDGAPDSLPFVRTGVGDNRAKRRESHVTSWVPFSRLLAWNLLVLYLSIVAGTGATAFSKLGWRLCQEEENMCRSVRKYTTAYKKFEDPA